MKTIEALWAEPVATTDRVVAAWVEAHPVVRRAVIAASVTAAALSTAVAAPTAVRWSTATVGVILALAALVDVCEHKLPNQLLLGALAAVASAMVVAGSHVVVSAILGLVLSGGLMMLVRLSRGVGMGDVKMAGVVGASVGSIELMAAPVAVAVAAAVAGVYGLLARRQRLPLGPSMWLGWAVALGACAAGFAPMTAPKPMTRNARMRFMSMSFESHLITKRRCTTPSVNAARARSRRRRATLLLHQH